jgi:proline iminopeptidase
MRIRPSLLALFVLLAPAGCASTDGVASSDDDVSPAPPPTAPPAGSNKSAPPKPGPKPPEPGPTPPQTTDLYHSEKGDPNAPAVVFLHGGPGANSMMFELTAQAPLAALGYHVVAYDQRGSTRSPAGTAKDYAYAKSTQDLDDLIGALHLKSPVLVAHSFGGSIALRYLDRFKGKAKGAILVSSPIDFPKTYDTCLSVCATRYQAWGRASDASKMNALRSSMFPHGVTPPFQYTGADIGSVIQCMQDARLYYPFPPTSDDAAFALTVATNADVTAVNPAVGDGYQDNDQVGYQEILPLLKAHAGEVYAVYAPSWDAMFSADQLDAIRANVKAFAEVADAGHFVFMDQTKAFVSAVAGHLAAMK